MPVAILPKSIGPSSSSRRRHLTTGSVLMLASIISGCSVLRPREDPARFYLLTAIPGVVAPASAKGTRALRIDLKPVDVPAYLRTGAMVVRTGAQEVRFADLERWAEPLAAGLARAMKAHLSSLRTVEFTGPATEGVSVPDCEVTMRILACEGAIAAEGRGSSRLALRWEIRSVGNAPAEAKYGHFDSGAVAWDGQHYDRLAVQLGEAVAAASAALAAELPK